MNRTQMQDVVDRLWALCDGAEPAVDVRAGSARGICADIKTSCGVFLFHVLREHADECCGFWVYGFRKGDWGNRRRCLAGVLAGYIEGMMEELNT